MKSLFILVSLFPVFFGFVSQGASPGVGAYNLYFENDYRFLSFGKPNADQNYTDGVKFSYLYSEGTVPRWAKILTGWLPPLRMATEDLSAGFNFSFSVGQHMYTPADIGRSDLIKNDQPYAGWLYAGFLIHLKKGPNLQSVQLDLGMIGPLSLAAQTQRFVHNLIGDRPPQGWDNQLKTEPGVSLFYQYKRKLAELRLGDCRVIDVIPHVGAALGNVFVYGAAGGTVRVGFNLSDDFGATRLNPLGVDGYVDPTGANQRGDFEMYLFAAAEGRAMARNIFLDGNTFAESHSVRKIPWISESELGLVLRIAQFRIAWRQVTRSAEFMEASEPHVYGAIALTYVVR